MKAGPGPQTGHVSVSVQTPSGNNQRPLTSNSTNNCKQPTKVALYRCKALLYSATQTVPEPWGDLA